MIIKKTNKDSLSLTLKPNKSSSINENFIFFGFLSIICLTFAIGFFILGATLILPFAGLEIIVLISVLKVNRDWVNQSEKIYLDKLYLKLKKGSNEITLDRFLSKFSVTDQKTKKRLFVTSGDKKIEIGSFLNEEDKDKLISLLKKKEAELNFS